MDITNVKRETLVKQYEEAKAKFDAANDSLKKDVEYVFSDWIYKKGVSSFCTFRADSSGYGELLVTDGTDNGEVHGILVRYAKRWHDDGSVRYELTMNYSCFGSISEAEDAKIKYSQVIGLLASSLTDLQIHLSHLDWIHVRELQKIYSRAEEALEEYDAEVEKAEHDRKVAEVLPLIKVGAKFNVGKGWNNQSIIATVMDMKRKYVDLDFVSKRMTREEIADKVISGKWKVSK